VLTELLLPHSSLKPSLKAFPPRLLVWRGKEDLKEKFNFRRGSFIDFPSRLPLAPRSLFAERKDVYSFHVQT
jgi:hypothetical protein